MTQPYEVTSRAHPAGRPLTTLPGPRGLPLVGNLLQLKVTQLHTILEHWADTYGPLYTFRLAQKPVVAIAAPALIQEVLRHRPETYRRLGAIARVLEEVGGNGVFAAEGAPWRRQRRVVQQALTLPQLQQFFPAGAHHGRVFHDLRRTTARNLSRADVPDRIAMSIMGHKTRAMYDRYNIVDEEDIRRGMQRAEDYVTEQGDNRVTEAEKRHE